MQTEPPYLRAWMQNASVQKPRPELHWRQRPMPSLALKVVVHHIWPSKSSAIKWVFQSLSSWPALDLGGQEVDHLGIQQRLPNFSFQYCESLRRCFRQNTAECRHTSMSPALQHLALSKGFLPDASLKKFAIESSCVC